MSFFNKKIVWSFFPPKIEKPIGTIFSQIGSAASEFSKNFNNYFVENDNMSSYLASTSESRTAKLLYILDQSPCTIYSEIAREITVLQPKLW